MVKPVKDILKPNKVDNPFINTANAQQTSQMTEPPAQPKITEPRVFRDSKTGELGGLQMPDGRVLLGLSPEEIQAMVGRWKNKTTIPEGAVGVAEAQQQKDAAKQQAAAMNVLNNPEQPMQLQQTAQGINAGEAVTAGVTSAIPNILKSTIIGAGAGAVGGSVIPGAGTAVGAIVGGGAGLIAGIYSAVNSNLKKQKTDTYQDQKDVLLRGRPNLKKYIALTKSDPAHSDIYANEFNKQLALIHQAHSKLKANTQSDLARFLTEDGRDQLRSFETFYLEEEDNYRLQMQVALMGGDPAAGLMELSQYESDLIGQ